MTSASKFGVLAIASVLTCGVALAAPAPAASATSETSKTTTHDMNVTVVSMDAKAHTMTVKDDAGKELTAKCMGDAVKEMSSVKAGEKVTLTCKDNAKGEHLGVIAVKPAKD
jgi:hypothetical protein